MSMPPYGPGSPQQPTLQPTGEPQPQQRMVRVRQPSVRPLVTYTILGITVLAYLLQELTNMGIGTGPFLALGQSLLRPVDYQQALANGGADILVLLGAKISLYINAGQFWRLITPVLLHASILHIAFNMYALFAIGPSLESFYGHWRYLALYLLGGLGGNVLSYLMTPGYSVGASTAIFGLVAAEGVFIYQNREIFGPRARAMLSNVVMVVIINLGLGLSPGIDNWGHLGGLITGLVFGWFAGPHMEVTYSYPDYELVDQRSPAVALLVGLALVILILGLVILRINKLA